MSMFRMPVVVLSITAMLGVVIGTALKKHDIEFRNTEARSAVVSPSASLIPVATSVPEAPKEAPRDRVWKDISDGKQAKFFDGWTIFRSTDEIYDRTMLQVCGYDSKNTENRLCAGGQYKNTSLHVDAHALQFDLYGSTVIEARFVFPNGSHRIKNYTGLAATQVGGTIVESSQVDDLWKNILNASYTVLRVNTYEGPVTMRFEAFPKGPKGAM